MSFRFASTFTAAFMVLIGLVMIFIPATYLDRTGVEETDVAIFLQQRIGLVCWGWAALMLSFANIESSSLRRRIALINIGMMTVLAGLAVYEWYQEIVSANMLRLALGNMVIAGLYLSSLFHKG
jgi:hypothetical protein